MTLRTLLLAWIAAAFMVPAAWAVLFRADTGWLALGFLGCAALYHLAYRWVAGLGEEPLDESTFADDMLEPQAVPVASPEGGAE